MNSKHLLLLPLLAAPLAHADEAWVIDSQDDWESGTDNSEEIEFADGMASPTAEGAIVRSGLQRFDEKRSATSIVFDQSPVWHNWEQTENIGTDSMADAPVLLSVGPDNYWMFARYGGGQRRGAQAAFTPEPATLEGFDVPLTTTRLPNQFAAPGAAEKNMGGYHAWQSRDMVNWVHHGSITEGFSRWMTSAEYEDGKFYFYYDFPNDQDPHAYVDEDPTDGIPGENVGKVLDDPSHGSDSGVIRDLDGKFHIIFEDWSPINASKRSWDSALAGHAVGDDGGSPFEIAGIAVDERTEPTGEIATYNHPHWAKEDPDNYATNVAEYEIHAPTQEAFGDWAAIGIGGRYYLFADYDPEHGKPMSTAWFTSESMDEQFTFCGNIGNGHPDPDICFAEGQFYLATQQRNDWVSPGPWVESVEVRVGVDTDNDGKVDEWSDWEEVKESYDHTPGFAKEVAKTTASADLSDLPEGYGFQFEARLTDTTENPSKPILDKVTLHFGE